MKAQSSKNKDYERDEKVFEENGKRPGFKQKLHIGGITLEIVPKKKDVCPYAGCLP